MTTEIATDALPLALAGATIPCLDAPGCRKRAYVLPNAVRVGCPTLHPSVEFAKCDACGGRGWIPTNDGWTWLSEYLRYTNQMTALSLLGDYEPPDDATDRPIDGVSLREATLRSLADAIVRDGGELLVTEGS